MQKIYGVVQVFGLKFGAESKHKLDGGIPSVGTWITISEEAFAL